MINGKEAGTEQVVRRFPYRIGRAPGVDLRLETEGVWDRHLEIRLVPGTGFLATAQEGVRVLINGQPEQSVRLRNGDVIGLGGAQVGFSLSPTRLRGLRLRESLTWIALGALCFGQVALIYWMIA